MYYNSKNDKTSAVTSEAEATVVEQPVIVKHRVLSTVSRAIAQIATDFTMLQSFAFVAKSGVNAGVMSIIFSSCMIFTPIIFYFKYGQKLGFSDLIGGLLIVVCVLIIGVGGLDGEVPKGIEHQSKEDTEFYLILSIIGCLLVGLFFSIRSLTLAYISEAGSQVMQANFDADFIIFMIFFPVWIVLQIKDNTFDWEDLMLGCVSRMCISIALVLMGLAFQLGKAGPVQAIDNQKSTWQMIITGFAYSQWPNVLQIVGMIIGFLGVNVFIFAKQTDDKKDNKE